jgi:hypothetical protein
MHNTWQETNRPPDVIRIVFISYNVVFLGVANQPPCHALEGALNAISKRVKGTVSPDI